MAMERRHIITIGGLPGSGKSSAAVGVATALGYKHFSSGDLFRKMAAERGVSIEEMNIVAEQQKAIDEGVDAMLRAMGSEKNDVVIDSRMAFHWIPDSFKVFLQLDPKIAAERIFAQVSAGERIGQSAASLEKITERTLARIESEKTRYRALYGVDVTDLSQYDMVIDTATHDLRSVIAMIVEVYGRWLANSHS